MTIDTARSVPTEITRSPLDFDTLIVESNASGERRLTVTGESEYANSRVQIVRRFPALRTFQVVETLPQSPVHSRTPFVASIPLTPQCVGLDGLEVQGKSKRALLAGSLVRHPGCILDDFHTFSPQENATDSQSTEFEPLTWAAVGTAIVLGVIGAAAGRAFNQWMDSIEPNRLEHFIRDVVNEFARRVERAISEDRIRLIMSHARSLHEHFSDYLADPTSAQGRRTLDQAEYECVEIITDVLHTDLDLQRGHGAFLDLAALRLAMLQEQIKTAPTRIRLFAKAAEQYGDQAYRLYEDWVNWHLSRFSDVYYDQDRRQFVFSEYGRLFVPADRLTPRDEVERIRRDRIFNGPDRHRLDAEVIEPANSIMWRFHDLSEYATPRNRVFTLRYRGSDSRNGMYLRAHSSGALELTSAQTFWDIEMRPDWGAPSWGDFDKYAIRCFSDGPFKGWYVGGNATQPTDPRPVQLRLNRRSSHYNHWVLEPMWNGRHRIRHASFLGVGAYLYVHDGWGVCFGRTHRVGDPPPWEIMEMS